MPSEWYNEEASANLKQTETDMIQKTLDHMNTIVTSAFENLEEFNQYGGEATIYNNNGVAIGIKLTHAIYGEEEFSQNNNKFEQYNKITKGNEYIAILTRQDGSIRDIQTNIQNAKLDTIYRWLIDTYKEIDYIVNSPTLFFLKRTDFRYHGPDETKEAYKTSHILKGK